MGVFSPKLMAVAGSSVTDDSAPGAGRWPREGSWATTTISKHAYSSQVPPVTPHAWPYSRSPAPTLPVTGSWHALPCTPLNCQFAAHILR